jgi:hypothetical protein
MATIGIVVSGGIVQSVYMDKKLASIEFFNVEIADFDNDGLDFDGNDSREVADTLMEDFDNNLTAIY